MKNILVVFVIFFASNLFADVAKDEQVLKDVYNRLLEFHNNSLQDENEDTDPLTNSQDAIDLYNAIALAYNNNSSLRAYRAEFESSVEVYPQAFSTWLPTAGLDFTYNEILSGDDGVSAATVPNYTLSAQISMNLFESFGGVNNIKSAGNLILALTYDYYNKEQTVVLEVITAYLEALKSSMVIDLRKKQAKALEEHFTSVSVGLRVGSATKTDVSQAKSSYLEALSLAQIASVDYNTAKMNLERMLGARVKDLKVPEHIELESTKISDIIKVVRSKNPVLLTAYYNNGYYQQQIDVTRSKLLPRVDAGIAYNYNSYKETVSFGSEQTSSSSDEIRGNISLNIPLYDAGVYRSQLRASKKSAEQAKFLLQDSLFQLQASARTSLETLKANLIYMDAISSQVDASYDALKGVKIEYNVGTKTNTDLLDAESDYYESQVNLVNAYMQYLLSQFDILYLSGSLGVKDLESVPVDKVYDPSLYVDKIKHKFLFTSNPDDVFIDREDNKK